LNRLFEQSPPHLYQLIDEAVLRSAYRFSAQNQLKTARLLGLSRNVVRARLIQYGEVAGVLRSAPERPPAAAARRRGSGRAQQVVRFGYQPFGLLRLLRAQGSLESALSLRGFRVEWRHFPSGIRLVEAFKRGEVSIGVVGEGPPIFAQASDVPIVYVAAEAPAPEAEAIVVHHDSTIRSVAGLRGKRVALLRGSNAHYLLIRALEEAGVAYREVAPKFVFQEAARARFQHRDVDAWAIGDPTLAHVQRELPVRVLRDGRGLTINPAYYVASAEFAAEHPELIALFRRELAVAQRWVSEHLDAAAEMLAPQVGLARDAVGLALRRSLGESLRRPEIIASQQSVADAFYRLKLIPRAVSVADATWPLE
jgi:sulfonate transport system substrate-binding protein